VVTGVDGRIYVAGGTTDCGLTLGCVGSQLFAAYNPNSGTWDVNTPQLPSMPTGRWGLAAVTTNGRIFAIGGANNCGSGVCTELNTVEAFSPVKTISLPIVTNQSHGL